MTDVPGPSTDRPPKRKLTSPFVRPKRLRCGPNSYLVVGNRHDPLNLEADDTPPQRSDGLISPVKNSQAPFRSASPTKLKHKKKKKHDSVEDENLFTPVFVSQRRFSIVQQKLKQQHANHGQNTVHLSASFEKESKDREKTIRNNLKYRFGNFNKYYGNRPQLAMLDQRLNYLCQSMFSGMDVLDIGCNSGLLTISIAKVFSPSRIVGMDIDGHLIKAAKQNIRYFCDKDLKLLHRFPASFPSSFGPISAPISGESQEFPQNLEFVCDNYVLEKDEDIGNVEPEFDVIMMFATTKWIHLNFGDEGIKRTFKRIFAQLKPKGKLLLEPLDFKSYRRSANSCSLLKKNFEKIEFKPENFRDYLLSEEVGFRHVEDVGIALAGFTGPLLIFYKDSILQNLQ